MKRKAGHIDHALAALVAILVVGGSMIFTSAAFGLLARGTAGMSGVFFNHLVLGVGAGIVALIVTASIDYHVWQRYTYYLYGAALVLTMLVFIPHIGASSGGGTRWISFAHISFQPSELLKIATIVLAAAYFSSIKDKVATLRFGLGGFCAIIALPSLLLIAQPDLGTLGVIVISALAVYWASGARWSHLALIFCTGVFAIAILAWMRPYVYDRIETFMDPAHGQQAQGYQIKQSLIAIGSGQVFGKGFGQGIQKFTYLPEPMGDSIFAVAGEELGFIGTVTIVFLFLAFGLRSYNVASRAIDSYGTLLGIGIASYLTIEAYINIAAILSIAPLTGIPLTFISQGGSAMLSSLASVGILLNISRFTKRSPGA